MWDDSHPFVIADLHGEVTLLQTLLKKIPAADVQLIFLGDYLDRGEDSFGTIHLLLLLAQERDCVFLRGNHDAAWLEVWTGEGFSECPLIPGARALWNSVQGRVPPEVGHFLERTQIDWEDAYAYYAHAGAEPGTPFRRTAAEVKIWGDGRFLTTSFNWGKPVIFGHYELPEPLITPTKIGLDTAAYRTGILTALDVVTRRIIQATR
jgi:serine/threonine protein phosphatase 1